MVGCWGWFKCILSQSQMSMVGSWDKLGASMHISRMISVLIAQLILTHFSLHFFYPLFFIHLHSFLELECTNLHSVLNGRMLGMTQMHNFTIHDVMCPSMVGSWRWIKCTIAHFTNDFCLVNFHPVFTHFEVRTNWRYHGQKCPMAKSSLLIGW